MFVFEYNVCSYCTVIAINRDHAVNISLIEPTRIFWSPTKCQKVSNSQNFKARESFFFTMGLQQPRWKIIRRHTDYVFEIISFQIKFGIEQINKNQTKLKHIFHNSLNSTKDCYVQTFSPLCHFGHGKFRERNVRIYK